MPVVYLDAYALALPVGARPEDEAYLRSLLELRTLRLRPCVTVRVPSDAAAVLAEGRRYPAGDAIPTSDQVQRKDVLTIVSGLLRGPVAEAAAHVSDCVVLDGTCTPATHLVGRDAVFIRHHTRLLALAALAATADPDGEVASVWTPNVPGVGARTEAQGTALIVTVNDPREDVQEQTYAVQVTLVDSLAAVGPTLDPVALWRRPGCQAAALEAFAARRAGHDMMTALPAQYTWAMGQQFVRTAEELGFGRRASTSRITLLLDTCADAILREKMPQTHELREAESPTSAVKRRARDNAPAWRRDVDREYHVHYWRAAGGVPELSCVVPHRSDLIYAN